MKTYIPLFEDFEQSKKTLYSGNEVAQHIIDITPEEHDIPDYFISKFIRPNMFERKRVLLKSLLETDPDFKEYFDSGEVRYDDTAVNIQNIRNEIVVYNGILMDGYSRVSKLLNAGEEYTWGFVHEPVNEEIVRKKDGWYVTSEKGKNLGGPYTNKADAHKRLGQVEFFKHKSKKKKRN